MRRGGHSGPKPLMPSLSLKLSNSWGGLRRQPKQTLSMTDNKNGQKRRDVCTIRGGEKEKLIK